MSTVITWIVIVVLLVLAILLFIIPGYSFSAWLSVGGSILLLCYFLLRLLGRRDRLTAKILRTAISSVLCLVIMAAALTFIPIRDASFGDDAGDCEYVVVLGAGVRGTVPSKILQNRIDAAVEYLRQHPDAICIVSGGQGSGEDISEAECMFYHLTAAGIPAERIWMEDRSTSTAENFAYSLALIEERTGVRPEKIGVISNEFHLYRAGLIARSNGVAAVGIPAKTSYLTLQINYTIREIAAVWFYTILGGN